MLKGIREDDKFAKETALTDEFKHTILHTDSLYTLMTRMTNPVHNVRAVLVALREIGFPGQFPKCKFDEGTGAMCGPCVMRNRNAVRNDANEKNHEPCFDRSLGGRAISCFDWQEWTYAALYCQLWVAGVRGGAHVLGVVPDGVGDQLASVSVIAAAQRVAGLVPGVVRGGVQRAVPGVRPGMARGDDVQGDRLEDRQIRLPVETVQAVALNPGRLIFFNVDSQTNEY